MSIVCPQCNTPVPATAIQNKQARCPECGYEFSVASLLQADETPKRDEISLPSPMKRTLKGDTLVIERSWGDPIQLGIIILTTVIFFCVLTSFAPTAAGWGLAILFGTIFIAYGVYYFFNYTTLTISPQQVTVQHYLFPNPQHIFPSSDIVQVYVKRIASGRSAFYQVKIVTNGTEHQTLFHSLPKAEQAQYIEQEIERLLKIESAPMQEEYDPRGRVRKRLESTLMPRKNEKSKF